MVNLFCSHSISPSKVLRGENAWNESMKLIPTICKSPLLIGRSFSTYKTRENLFKDLHTLGLNPTFTEITHDCCELDLEEATHVAIEKNCDGIITAGGGKVLDTGKLIADRLSLPCITIPLSASTCAGWTALANIYSPEGSFQKDVILRSCPNLLVFDHSLIRGAPKKTIASGIADGLAKWYESSLTSSSSNDGLVQQAVQMARVLRDQLLIDGKVAYEDSTSDEWIRIAEGSGLTAGLIGGIGGTKCRTAAAHAVHNGLTQLIECNHKIHGEIVGFGILTQLRIEEIVLGNKLAYQSRKQLLPFLKDLNLPVRLKDLGLEEVSISSLKDACNFACSKSPEISFLPFEITADLIIEAMFSTEEASIPIEK